MSGLADALKQHMQSLAGAALGRLEALVSVNSFTSNPAGVNRVAGLTAEMFAELGFEWEMRPSDNPAYGSHLLLTRRGSGGGAFRPVVFVTHSDTVFPPEEEKRHDFRWRPAPEEGRIYGPGTVDIKGGTVLIWMMLHALARHAPEVFVNTDWLVASNASEEVIADDFARHVRACCPEGARAVLVFEGGPRVGENYHIVTARKGRAEYRVSAAGRAAHAGSAHQDGANAVVALAAGVARIAAVTDYSRELTVNVATFQGGTVLNRVPHEAAAEIEVRAYEPELLDLAESAMRQAVAQTESEGGGRVKLQLDRVGRTAAWPERENSLELLEHWKLAAPELGITVTPVKRGGLSDANYLCGLGPMLDGLGPSGANAHCSEHAADGSKTAEFVEPDTLITKGALNVLALVRLLEGK